MAEHFINALGDMCPIPNSKVQSKIKKLQPGDRIVLLTDHSCAVTTIIEEMKRRRLKSSVEEVDNGIWKLTITIPSQANKNRG